MDRYARPARLSGDPDVPRLRGWLHFFALVIAVPTGAILLARTQSAKAVFSIGLYAIGLVALYAVSAGYHLVKWSGPARARMRRVDRAMIYVFIAACYTPLCLLVIGGTFGAGLLVVGWSAALAGILTTILRATPSRAAAVGYLAVGWLLMVALPRVVTRLDASELMLLVGGGLAYTFGSIVLATRRPDPAPRTFGYHEVWHALVIAGSACHYALFWRLVQP